jgi:hypothetical protein
MIGNVDAKLNSAASGNGCIVGTCLPGEVITISCSQSETWNLNTAIGRWACNANGRPNTPLELSEQVQVFDAGALVGSFDGGRTFFSVGLFSVITVCAYNGINSPELSLYCWDSYQGDNNGIIHVQIQRLQNAPS